MSICLGRRDFIIALGGAAVAWPLAASAQRTVPRVGFFSNETPTTASAMPTEAYEWLTTALRDLGYFEGRNIAFERRFSVGRLDQLSFLAAELVRAKVDVIVAVGDPAAIAAKATTQTIPIVFTQSGNPVDQGLVASLARPGGNVTGLSSILIDLGSKKVELLHEAVPGLKRLGVLWNPDSPVGVLELKEVERATEVLNIELRKREWRQLEELPTLISAITGQVDALYMGTGPPASVEQRARFAEAASHARLPMMTNRKEYVVAGALMSYGPNYVEMYRKAASYVDRILRGTNPAALPVEQPTRFELAVNLKTAKSLGLTLPPTLRVLADEVIE
jgi:putative ABC transport system substrate-binding protein